MADIRLITILPSQTVSGVQQPNISVGVGSQGTPNIASLPPGATLAGFIINRDANGNPILRTDRGDVVFQSNMFLKIGSEVVIRIENIGHNTLAHILSVDGETPEIAAAKPVFPQPQDVILSKNLFSSPASAPNQTQATPSVIITPQPVITLKATLIAQPPPSAPLPPMPLPNGTQLTLKIVTLSAPPSAVPEEVAAAFTPSQPPPSLHPPANPVSYAAYTRASGVQPLPASIPIVPQAPGTPVAAITANAPQTTPSLPGNISQLLPQTPVTVMETTPQSPATNQSLPATVISNDPGGEAIVQTPLGVLRLPPDTLLPVGSKITFEVMQTAPPVTQAATANVALPQTPAPLTELAQHWQAMQQIFAVLSAPGAPSGFESFINTVPAIIAHPGAAPQTQFIPQSISAGLMLFVAALRGGDFTNWVGKDNVRWLNEQGHGTLLKKAEGEFLGMARQFTETQPQHWQPVFFPVAVDGVLQQVRVFVKRDRKQGTHPQEKKKEDTRFVVEVDLTQLGEIQMDGFVRRGEDVHFDLVIRSLSPLSEEIRQAIGQIYNDTGQITGYKGSLIFQSVKEFPVNPMEDIVAHAMNRVTV